MESTPPSLLEQTLIRNEGILSNHGAIIVNTGEHTGRSPNDKYIALNNSRDDELIWWGRVNSPISPDKFDRLYEKIKSYLQGRDIFINDMVVGAHPSYELPIRVINEYAWHSLASRHLFRRLPDNKLEEHIPEFTLICCPNLKGDPIEYGLHSHTFIAIDLTKKLILIGGTSYAGEIKKSIFSVMNYVLPMKNVLCMNCSANVGEKDDVALFFGLSGTGKTSLSSDSNRNLIGDDEHGWSDDGIFNIEGGCYAKTINLDQRAEPLIWKATKSFGTVLENLVYDPFTRIPD